MARALAGAPSVILADEPTAALDSENGKAVMELLSKVAKDPTRAVLAVTHDHRTLAYADRIIRIEDGKNSQRRAAAEKRQSQLRCRPAPRRSCTRGAPVSAADPARQSGRR